MNQEINARIEQIKNGEVPLGYKKGKLGIVPTEWDQVNFSTLFTSTSDYTNNLDEYPLYSLTIENGITAKTERYERSHLVKKENAYKIVNPNDYAFNPMNIRFGAVARNKGDISVAVSGYYDIFTTIRSEDLEFMDIFLTCDSMLTYYNKVSTGSLVEKQRVHFSQFIDFNIELPPLKERKKIADVLTNQNKVIELKEKLIAEKQQKKKWLMKNLLTGKIRLKEFSGEWKETKLNCISKKVIDKNSNIVVDLVFTNSAQCGIIPQRDHFDKDIANSENIDGYYIVEPYYFVYNPRISVTAPCGPINCNLTGCTGVMSPLYTVFKVVTNEVNKHYLVQYFNSTIWFRYVKSVANYGARFDRMNITDKDFFSMTLVLPALSEQTAIAEILSTADREIELLQKDLAEEKQKKKALMQLLLTGIVRV